MKILVLLGPIPHPSQVDRAATPEAIQTGKVTLGLGIHQASHCGTHRKNKSSQYGEHASQGQKQVPASSLGSTAETGYIAVAAQQETSKYTSEDKVGLSAPACQITQCDQCPKVHSWTQTWIPLGTKCQAD